MRTLIVGDVHGCALELTRLLEKAEPDRVVLVGDLFTKGPDPVGVWKQIKERQMEGVLGNHDKRLLDVLEAKRTSDGEALACVAALDAEGGDWQTWLKQLPLSVNLESHVVVHAGLHPLEGMDGTSAEMAINLRLWKDRDGRRTPWHQVYDGAMGVVFGHDARQGLVVHRRNGRRWIVGLDTGCVYGGALTGYLLESDRLFQVRAARTYRPV